MSTLLEHGRTHDCGSLRAADVGATVVLFGWVHRRRDLGARIFVQLRDRFGITQVVFGKDLDADAYAAADGLRGEFCVAVRGAVVARGDNTNAAMATGEIEVHATALQVFSPADVLPFNVADDDKLDASEALRLKHRYLDLRRPSLQKNFVVRSRLATLTRIALAEQGFLELETPYMVKYTPGGARNFLVPSRLNPGMFYALAESPQIFKQLFMVAGMDKYFQICRCFRDEDLRNDRQPEFTQIDVEISFATPERVFAPIEGLIRRAWSEILGVTLPDPFPRMTWAEAMSRFGSDKPDLRFGLEFVDITDLAHRSGAKIFESAPAVKAIVVPAAHAETLSRGRIDKLTELVKKRESGGAKGLAWAKVQEGGAWNSPLTKFISPEFQAEISRHAGAETGSVILIVADALHTVHAALNALRLELRDSLDLVKHSGSDPWRFLWVTDFPLFEKSERGYVSAHHPFTSPRLDQLPLLDSDPSQVLAQAYDLVLNGNEVGGGSIRIHQSEVQAKIFQVLGLSEAQIQQKFGFLLDAFKYGPPPHGGIALGLDRLSMLMCGAQSLRDVIAFPKTQKGTDLMTGCPGGADDAQLAELYIRHRDLPADV
ncbi:aspartate--tRNA ligase [Nannocystis sp. SCPEA4]|uniref:aspartate--tRNA ligase n=1 Tax=Nannocystis sp. SCPEA4 TaxID=2996787 RepID=UPI002270BBF9|nr:aspartate--tRNA ligase [Nannocystis sp. SCPEA4]MCY1062223.1 aspartate--tRNA ligase [Nannocystis sp. SCPEA4]